MNGLKDWQTAIGSIFGFVALMSAALWNFRLNRSRDAAIRAEEALSVAAALYGEILLLRKEIGHLAEMVAGLTLRRSEMLDEHFLEAHPLAEPLLYKALAPKIGLLSPDLIISITEFHKNLQEAKTALPLLLEKPGRKYSYSALTFLIPARSAVRNIEPTLGKIERMASVVRTAEIIDLSQAETVIDMEETSFNS